MTAKFKVGDRVKVTADRTSFIHDHLTYQNRIGTINATDRTGYPYRVIFDNGNDYDWFRLDELIRAPATTEDVTLNIIKDDLKYFIESGDTDSPCVELLRSILEKAGVKVTITKPVAASVSFS